MIWGISKPCHNSKHRNLPRVLLLAQRKHIKIYTAAGYTYGPLLGLFFFGLFTKWSVRDMWVPVIAVLSPLVSYLLKIKVDEWFGYANGFELLLINGAITFLGLMLLTKKD